MKPFRTTLVSVLTLLVTTISALAQLSTAQLSGRITDESGATLPGVTVTVTQTDTGLVRSVVTNETGTYVVPNLPTGPYRLEAMLQAFDDFMLVLDKKGRILDYKSGEGHSLNILQKNPTPLYLEDVIPGGVGRCGRGPQEPQRGHPSGTPQGFHGTFSFPRIRLTGTRLVLPQQPAGAYH